MGVVPYRDTVPRGLFATRDPVRPNPIGLSCVRLIGIEGNILRVAELDILNGTPLLDLKTYVPDYDAYPLGRVRWLGNRVLDVVEVDNGASGYFRCDWFTPDGLRTWGDGRTIILGTEGFIELRKYTNLASEQPGGDHLFLVNNKGEQYIPCAGKVGYPFFGQLILDCLNRTENAMTQAHAFKAAELCLKAQERAVHLV